jgi:membrane protein required for colicin V production
VTWLDYAVAGVLLFCVLFGLWRGLVREVVSVLGWVIAFLAANLFAGQLGRGAAGRDPNAGVAARGRIRRDLRLLADRDDLIGLLLSKMVKAVGLEGLDRTLGALFGTAKGYSSWSRSRCSPGLPTPRAKASGATRSSARPLARSALAFKPMLPPTFAERLRYD